MILIRRLFLKSRHFVSSPGPRKHPRPSQLQMLRPAPRTWLKAWRRVIQTLLGLELLSLQWMSKMVKLQLRRFPRAWLTLQETTAQQEADKKLARMKREPWKLPTECSHPELKNKYGSHAACTLCLSRVRWNPDGQAWQASAGWLVSQRPSLPRPPFSNNYIASATQSKSKPKPKPQAAQETQPAPLLTAKSTARTKSGIGKISKPFRFRVKIRSTRAWAAHGAQGRHGRTQQPVRTDEHHRHEAGTPGKDLQRHAAEAECRVYEALATKRQTDRSRSDILEAFVGRGISQQATKHDLIARTPMDYNTGFDLATERPQNHPAPVAFVLDC